MFIIFVYIYIHSLFDCRASKTCPVIRVVSEAEALHSLLEMLIFTGAGCFMELFHAGSP